VKHLAKGSSKDSSGINQNSSVRLIPLFGEDNPNTKIPLPSCLRIGELYWNG